MPAGQVVVTGSAGHLGEALVRTLRAQGVAVAAVDSRPSAFTSHIGSITDARFLKDCMRGCETVFHCASLHKRHLASRGPQQFVDVNVSGTLAVLEAAAAAGASSVVYSSTTSVYGSAFKPGPADPAVFVDEALACIPKDIYGVTKKSAEDLCELFARTGRINSAVLRIARFYPESESSADLAAEGIGDLNLKVNDFLYRRLDLEDLVEAHLLASSMARRRAFSRYVISATSPFSRAHASRLRHGVDELLRELVPEYADAYTERGWRAPHNIGRVYCNDLARRELQWEPRCSFQTLIARLRGGAEPFSELARAVGCKPY